MYMLIPNSNHDDVVCTLPRYFNVHMKIFLTYKKPLYTESDLVKMLDKIVGDKWKKSQIYAYAVEACNSDTGNIEIPCIDGLLLLYYSKKTSTFTWVPLKQVIKEKIIELLKLNKVVVPWEITYIKRTKVTYEILVTCDNGDKYIIVLRRCPPYRSWYKRTPVAFHYLYGILSEGIIQVQKSTYLQYFPTYNFSTKENSNQIEIGGFTNLDANEYKEYLTTLLECKQML